MEVILPRYRTHVMASDSNSPVRSARCPNTLAPRTSINRPGSEQLNPLDLAQTDGTDRQYSGEGEDVRIGRLISPSDGSSSGAVEKGSVDSDSINFDVTSKDVRILKSLSVNKFEAFLDTYSEKLSLKYRSCGLDGIGFSCPSCGHHQYVPKSCGIRGCPTCGKYQFARLYRRYDNALKRLPQHHLRKVELTAGHLPIDKASLNEWFTAACEVLDLFWKGKGLGWFAALEVSPGGHVHLHAITAGRYVGQKALSAAAAEKLNRPVVWISRNSKVRYLLKDCAKVPEFKSEDLRIRYFLATRGLRMYRSRGLLYGLGKNPVRSGFRLGYGCPCCGTEMIFDGVECRQVVSTPPPERFLPPWVVSMMNNAGVFP